MKNKDQILLEQAYQKISEGWRSETNKAMGYDDDFEDYDSLETLQAKRKENGADKLQDFIEQIASDAVDYAESRPYPPDIENFINQSLNSEEWKNFWDKNRGAYERAKEEVYKIFSEYNPNFFRSYR
jgi:hypothetical protein